MCNAYSLDCIRFLKDDQKQWELCLEHTFFTVGKLKVLVCTYLHTRVLPTLAGSGSKQPAPLKTDQYFPVQFSHKLFDACIK